MERDIQTVRKRMAANFADQMLLSLNFWGHNMKAVCTAINSFPNTKCPHTSPLYEFTGVAPNIASFTTKFGEPGVVSIVGKTTRNQFDSEVRPKTKQDAKNEFAISLGFPMTEARGVLCFIPGRNADRRSFEPHLRMDFTSIIEQIPELTDADRRRLELSADNDLFEFKTRIPDASITADYPSTIRPTDESLSTTRTQQPFQDIVEQQDLCFFPDPADPQRSLSDQRSAEPQQQHRAHRSGRVSATVKEHFVNANCLLDPTGDDFPSCVTLKRGDDCWHCFEDEDEFVPHPALLEHLTQKYNMVFGVKRQVRTDDNPTLARAQKDLWHIWEAPVRLEFKNIDDMNVKETIRFEDIPRGAQVLQLIMNLSTKRYSSGDIEKLKARLLLLGNHEWQTLEEAFRPQLPKKLCCSLSLSWSSSGSPSTKWTSLRRFCTRSWRSQSIADFHPSVGTCTGTSSTGSCSRRSMGCEGPRDSSSKRSRRK